MVKYEITDITADVDGVTLHRIKALKDVATEYGHYIVRKGELGGFIENPINLSQEGTCWIGGNAMVMGNATVKDAAIVQDHAVVKDSAVVCEKALVQDFATVQNVTHIYGSATIEHKATITDGAIVKGISWVGGKSIVSGTSEIGGSDYCAVDDSNIIDSTIDDAAIISSTIESTLINEAHIEDSNIYDGNIAGPFRIKNAEIHNEADTVLLQANYNWFAAYRGANGILASKLDFTGDVVYYDSIDEITVPLYKYVAEQVFGGRNTEPAPESQDNNETVNTEE